MEELVRARALLKAGHYEAARRLAALCVQANPKAALAWFVLAQAQAAIAKSSSSTATAAQQVNNS